MVTPLQIPLKTLHGARMTADEFDLLPEREGGYIELLEGEVVVVGGASMPHQQLVVRLMKLMFSLKLDERGKLLVAPFSVKLDYNNVPEPDILWISNDNPVKYEHARIVGAPDFIVEILSASTGKQDKTTKFDVYERNGVKEYWIADPNIGTIDVFVLNAGRYERLGTYGEGDSFESPSLGTRVALNGVFVA